MPSRFARIKALGEEAHRKREEVQRLRESDRLRRRGKRPLDVEPIARVALAIADVQGVDEVSMRRIAGVLGVGTMSLYHYVKTKEELLAAMDELIMGEILVPERELQGGWRQGMTAIARSTREAYRRHPWALTVQGKGQAGINSVKHVEQSLSALTSTGLDFRARMGICIIVDDYVFGHALRSAERFDNARHANAPEQAAASLGHFSESFGELLKSGQFPTLAASIGDADPIAFLQSTMEAFEPDGWFETGLEVLLDGLARKHGLSD